MTLELNRLKEQLLALPEPSRAWLAQALITSLDAEKPSEVESLWLNEIRRRDQEIADGKPVLRPATEVMRDAYEKIRCRR